MRVVKNLFCVYITLFSFILADPSDGCQLDTNHLFLTSSGDVLYNSDTDIGGFQFNVDGTTASGASGGAAADAGFNVMVDNNIVRLKNKGCKFCWMSDNPGIKDENNTTLVVPDSALNDLQLCCSFLVGILLTLTFTLFSVS